MDDLISLVDLTVVAQGFCEGITRPLGLPIRLKLKRSRKLMLSPHHDGDSVIKLGDELPSAIGKHTRRCTVHVHSVFRELVGDNGGPDDAERYQANQFYEPVSDQYDELLFTLPTR